MVLLVNTTYNSCHCIRLASPCSVTRGPPVGEREADLAHHDRLAGVLRAVAALNAR